MGNACAISSVAATLRTSARNAPQAPQKSNNVVCPALGPASNAPLPKNAQNAPITWLSILLLFSVVGSIRDIMGVLGCVNVWGG